MQKLLKTHLKATGIIALSILVAFVFFAIAQWLSLEHSMLLNSILIIGLFFAFGLVFGLLNSSVGIIVFLLFMVTMLLLDDAYYVLHFYQDCFVVLATFLGCFIKKRKLIVASVITVILGFTLYKSIEYHRTAFYSDVPNLEIEQVNENNELLLNHNNEPLVMSLDTVYLLNFSFLSCKPCRLKKDALTKISKRFSKAPFKIIDIHCIEDREVFLNKYFIDYGVTYHDSLKQLSKVFEVSGAPTEFIFDKKGKVVRRFDGFNAELIADYEKSTCYLIKSLLDEKGY